MNSALLGKAWAAANFLWNPRIVKNITTLLKLLMTNELGTCIIEKALANRRANGPSRSDLSGAGFVFGKHCTILGMKRIVSHLYAVIRLLSLALCVAGTVVAQSLQERQFIQQAGGGWWFSIVLIVVGIAGVAGFFLWRRSQSRTTAPTITSAYSNYYNSHESYEMDGLDVDKELEWLRKAKKPKTVPQPKKSPGITPPPARAIGVMDLDTRAFQERMRKMQYSQLPINSFADLRPAKLYEPLPVSDDPSLLNAIEQASEEFEEDESVRELAVKILTAFRTRNSVDALAQIALYDLSSNLRSKAVSILTDFDHASVFEPILLACADPTREVRAAAARGLFRLSFDRADAWKRIIETNDEFRMRHAARAAVESGFVVKSFERLVHEDLKVAQEAFSLTCLIVESGETETVFDSIKNHKDERVKFALLHVLKVRCDQRTLPALTELLNGAFSVEVRERINDAIASFTRVAV